MANHRYPNKVTPYSNTKHGKDIFNPLYQNMHSDSQIGMLQEMGFSKDQALEALKASGNDLNKAISFLFGEVEASSGNGTQSAPFDVDNDPPITGESIPITNPHEIPEFLGSYPSNSPMKDVRHYDRPLGGERIALSSESIVSGDENMAENFVESRLPAYSSGSSSSLSDGVLSNSSVEEQEEQEEEEYPENIKTDFTNVPFLLTRKRDTRCWVPLLLILAHTSIFARPILESNRDSDFVKEIQRIVYFVQNFNNSKRWYVDTEDLSALIQNEGPRGTYQDEEMVLNMIDFLMRNEPNLRPVFESMVESLDEEINKELTVLEIDADSRGATLYETLNELFWQREFEFLGRIKYSSVAPIVAYQLVADLDASCVPFQLQEVIYPEIYSDKALRSIQNEIHAIKRAQMDYQGSNRKLMDLNFFEGKKIDGLLSQTASALQESNTNASKDIQELVQMIQQCRLRELENQTQAKNYASPQRLASFEGVIANTPGLRPYKLLGVIFSESRYFVRAADSWVDMEAGVTVGFESVRDTVAHNAGPHNITLVYGDAEANEPLTLVDSEPETGSESESSTNSGSAAEIDVKEKTQDIKKDDDIEETSKMDEIGDKNTELPNNADATSSHVSSNSMLAATHSDVFREEVKDTEQNDGNSSEIVKRPRWDSENSGSDSAPSNTSLTNTFSKTVCVKRSVVQRYLQDEETAVC